jgi:hypothetical protein
LSHAIESFPLEQLNTVIRGLTMLRDHVAKARGAISRAQAAALLDALREIDGLPAAFEALAAAVTKGE